MKSTFLWAGVSALALVVPFMDSHAEDRKDDLKPLMKRKLEASQKVLEGIALNDSELVGKNADELLQISKAVEFKVLKTAQYELYSNEFRSGVENLGEMAKSKNGDGAALAYVEVTLTCVK
jgi:hypothetical protein